MAIIFLEGFDALQQSDLDIKRSFTANGGSSASFTVDTTNGRRGGRCLKVISTTTLQIPFPSSLTTVYMGFAFKCYSAGPFGGSTSFYLVKFANVDSNTQFHIWINSSGQFVASRNGTTLATSTLTVTTGTWYYIEIQITADNTTGAVLVKIDGQEYINITGQDTIYTGSTESYSYLEIFRPGSSAYMYYDDIYIDNAELHGDCRVDTLVPTGAGNYTQFDTTASAGNYAAVDEIPFSASDYNSSSTLNEIDSFDMTTFSGGGGILAVQVNTAAKKSDAGTRAIKDFCRSNSTDYTGDENYLSTDTQIFTKIRTVDPNTSAAWTSSGLNNAEFGYKLTV